MGVEIRPHSQERKAGAEGRAQLSCAPSFLPSQEMELQSTVAKVPKMVRLWPLAAIPSVPCDHVTYQYPSASSSLRLHSHCATM